MEEKYYKATNVTTGQIIAQKVKIAQDYKSRSVGLLNRVSLGDDEGLLIKPCNSIHTFFMKFPIDVIFLDKAWKVVSMRSRLMPWRMAWAIVGGFIVLELSAGILDKKIVSVGNTVKID